jgi:predicted NBD/HSP70 family sugar kinase
MEPFDFRPMDVALSGGSRYHPTSNSFDGGMARTSVPNLTDSARAVLRLLATRGAVTRPKLGAILDLSKPTMSAAVAELSALDLVETRGTEKGAIGRTATIYGLGPAAGYVMGIDVGAAQVRAVAYSLDGQPLATLERSIPPGHIGNAHAIGDVVLACAIAAIEAVGGGHGDLDSVAVAVPRIVSRDRVGHDPLNGPELVIEQLRGVVDVPVLLENNVNCAAIGEMHYGVADGHDTFAYLQVGVRVGLGIMAGRQLFRGAGGAAGEVGRLPFPWSLEDVPTREGLEHYLGSQALVERCRQTWPPAEGDPPASAKELFERAEHGSAHAGLWVARHAADIGRVAAGCVGMLDPGLIVLGGGVGQNPQVIGAVERVVRELAWPTRIAVSSLGDSGTVLGAMKLAADYSLCLILGEDRRPPVVLMPLSARRDVAAAQ